MTDVFIDPGHGGLDRDQKKPGLNFGCWWDGKDRKWNEKDLNLSLSYLIFGKLLDKGYDVEMSRFGDDVVSLPERTHRANASEADLFLSIHHNWFDDPSARGSTVFHYMNSSQGERVAERIATQMDQIDELPNRGARPSDPDRDEDPIPYLFVLSHTVMPAILFESGFLSSPEDRDIILEAEYQHIVSDILVAEVEHFLQ